MQVLSKLADSMKEEYDLRRNSGIIVRLPKGGDDNFECIDLKLCRHVLVAGLGRSGTTAIARLLNELGFDFCGEPELMESKSMRELLLKREFSQLNTEIEAWDKLNRCGWKEPKLSSYKTKEFIHSLPKNIALVIVFRDLVSSACRRSLEDEMDYLENLELTHNAYGKLLEMVRLQTNRLCVFVSYEKILTETLELSVYNIYINQ